MCIRDRLKVRRYQISAFETVPAPGFAGSEQRRLPPEIPSALPACLPLRVPKAQLRNVLRASAAPGAGLRRLGLQGCRAVGDQHRVSPGADALTPAPKAEYGSIQVGRRNPPPPVSYTHLRAHETPEHL